MRAALLVLVPLALAGCASEDGGFGLQRNTGSLEPYFREYREVVSGSHAKQFEVPVDAQARLVNVTLQLDARTNGLPVPEAAPAQLHARLLDPSGTLLQEARLDARQPEASLLVADAPAGLYTLEVRGTGAAQELDGSSYGAGYVATIDIDYG